MYRIVMFDNLGWGLNTRLEECPGTESPEAAEEWLRHWMYNCINALDVPQKFYLYGHSMGGWLVLQYATMCPERIEAVFVSNPLGLTDYNEETWPGYA